VNALLAGNDDALETALWAAVRPLEEIAGLKRRTAAIFERGGSSSYAARLSEDAHALIEQAKLLHQRIIGCTEGVIAGRRGSFAVTVRNRELLRSLLVVRLACLDFLHCLIYELNGLLAMPSLVWAGLVQFCSGLLQVSIGCAHVRLVTRHLLTLGMTSQGI
jgi:hypothetical protein